ncbi:MAG: hypothetical protein ACJ8C4_14060 [Gemmataceae bacterium]
MTPNRSIAAPGEQRMVRFRRFLEGPVAEDDRENVQETPTDETRPNVVESFNLRLPTEDVSKADHRKTAKTSVVHRGQHLDFEGIDELIEFFEAPDRKQEKWWGKEIKRTTDKRKPIELVDVTIKRAWVYELSHQPDRDYHLLVGVHPQHDEGRYVNIEVTAIDPKSPDAMDLLAVRRKFQSDYEAHQHKSLPSGFTQPKNAIPIRVSGSIFLDADHGREITGHGDIKNFTTWEIHPVTKIEFLNGTE